MALGKRNSHLVRSSSPRVPRNPACGARTDRPRHRCSMRSWRAREATDRHDSPAEQCDQPVLQLPLQPGHPGIGSGKPLLRFPTTTRTYVRPPSVRNPAYLYEHMFPHTRKRTLAQRTVGALRLVRAFLLLEDDYEVDWEVDENDASRSTHLHRVSLPGRVGGARPTARRPGQPSPAQHVCVSPVSPAAPSRAHSRIHAERHKRSASASRAASDTPPPARDHHSL
jgi:hypothetical protein